MVDRVKVAKVKMWGRLVGAVLWDESRQVTSFEYDPEFTKTGLEVSPLIMPLHNGGEIFAFNSLNKETYRGLPGLLADSLPDYFGNQLIDAWLLRQGRDPNDFNPIERLCYTGKRGMGALEYEPAIEGRETKPASVDVKQLVELAKIALGTRSKIQGNLKADKADTLKNILRVGTSAGGMRAKAVIAYNAVTGDVRSGQLNAPPGFEHWLLKLDGVNSKELGDPEGFGRIEYAYYRMAQSVGIQMEPCKLFEEGGRAHFMTRRFDRTIGGDKLHLQSLCAIAHFDYQAAGVYSYEQAFDVMRKLDLVYSDFDQLYRRLVFNVIARNQDDHTKNISFLMNHNGLWSLSPAYDVTYSYNPGGLWTNAHQMRLNGKTDNFTKEDILETGKLVGINKPQDVLLQVQHGVADWDKYANEAGVSKIGTESIKRTHRIFT